MSDAKVAVVSDVHMRDEHAGDILAELERTVEEIRAFDPDLLVVLGDVVHSEGSAEADRQNARRVMETLDALDCEIRYTAGNQDAMTLDTGDLTDLFGAEPWGRIDVGDETFVVLDTSAPRLSGPRGEVPPDQIELLDETLSRVEDAVVFAHHPIHYHDVQDSYWWTDVPELAFCTNKREVDDRLQEHGNAKLVVNGHLHQNDCTEYEGTPHVTLNAFSHETKEKPVTGTYATLRVGDRTAMEVRVSGETVAEYEV